MRVLAFYEGSPQRAPFLVMERMEESLSSFLRVLKDPLPIGDRFEIIKDICQVWYTVKEEFVPRNNVADFMRLTRSRRTACSQARDNLSNSGHAVSDDCSPIEVMK